MGGGGGEGGGRDANIMSVGRGKSTLFTETKGTLGLSLGY
jgi:hypothetical protein